MLAKGYVWLARRVDAYEGDSIEGVYGSPMAFLEHMKELIDSFNYEIPHYIVPQDPAADESKEWGLLYDEIVGEERCIAYSLEKVDLITWIGGAV